MPTPRRTLRRPARAALAILLLVAAVRPASADEPDRDKDGLPDFQEIHKYCTDPGSADSDGDGTPDGDWSERREYTYSVRTILRVLPPINAATLCDDYQDGRVVAQTARYVELELIHYPLNTAGSAIGENRAWRSGAGLPAEQLRAGVTTNWDDAMRRDLLAQLRDDGIDVDLLSDRATVEQVSRWALRRVPSRKMFNAFHVHYPDGVPSVVPGREQSVLSDRGDPSWSLQEQIEHELLGRQMYYHRTRGTCTSTAVLLTTVLRAVGIPTRMILCTPLVDASGGDNLSLVERGLTHHGVRSTVLRALAALHGSNASHTFNEVFVDGRWRRLNADRLGQNTLDAGLFGLISHVHTFDDLSAAGLDAWGGRKADDVFRYQNTYTATHVSDLFGAHANISNPPVEELKALRISKIRWLSDTSLPRRVRDGTFQQDGSGHLFLHADDPGGDTAGDDYRTFYESVSKKFRLTAEKQPPVLLEAERGYWLAPDEDCREFYVRIPPAQLKKLKAGVAYRLECVGLKEGAPRWDIAADVRIEFQAAAAKLVAGKRVLKISAVRWLASEDLPQRVRDSDFPDDGSGHLFLHADKPAWEEDASSYNAFYEWVDKEFELVAEGQVAVKARAERGFWIDVGSDCREFYVRVPAEEMSKLRAGVKYRLRPRDANASWRISESATIQK